MSLKKPNILEARQDVTVDFASFFLFALIDLKAKIFKANRKKSFNRVSNYSTILVITKIYVFLLLLF